MKRYTAAAARQQFSRVLDAAERGEAVIIERRGVRFRIHPESRATKKIISPPPVVELTDDAVVEGRWTWDWEAKGLRFVSPKRGERDPSRY